MEYIIPLLICGLPPVTGIAVFVFTLIDFCRTPKGSDERKIKKRSLILNSIFGVVSLVVIIVLIDQVVYAVANK